jgi:hypothetical protein
MTRLQKIKIFTVLTLLVVGLSVYSQNFEVGHRQQTFTDPARSNRQIPCEIYYPAQVGGDDATLATGSFPLLVFGHGFVMSWESYDIYWNTLVPEGYIMVFPTTEGSFSPSHLDFGKDLAFLCQTMQAEGNNGASPFYNAVGDACAAMGHSMGGGSAFLAMELDESIDLLATFAPAVTDPSSVTAAASVFKPSLVFAGANDCVTPPEDHQIPMYDALTSSCKTYLSVTGGDHCQFSSGSVTCSLGQTFCSPQAAIDGETQLNTVFSLLLPWLDFYLKNECDAATVFQNLISSGNGITSEQNCSLSCNPNAIEGKGNNVVYSLYPNPCQEQLFFECMQTDIGLTYCIDDMYGRHLIFSVINNERTEIHMDDLPEGMYVFSVNGRAKRKFIKNR